MRGWIVDGPVLALLLAAGAAGYCLSAVFHTDFSRATDPWTAIGSVATFSAVVVALFIPLVQRGHQVSDRRLTEARAELNRAIQARVLAIYIYGPMMMARRSAKVAHSAIEMLVSVSSRRQTFLTQLEQVRPLLLVSTPQAVRDRLSEIYLMGDTAGLLAQVASALDTYAMGIEGVLPRIEAMAAAGTFDEVFTDVLGQLESIDKQFEILDTAFTAIYNGDEVREARAHLAALDQS